MRGCQKIGERSKATNISNHKTRTAPHFINAILLMSAQSAKSEAILRRTTIKPNKGASPCRHEQTQRLPRAIQRHYIFIHCYSPRESTFHALENAVRRGCLNGSGCGNTWIYMHLCIYILLWPVLGFSWVRSRACALEGGCLRATH